MSFEKGLSKVVVDSTVSLTADELFYCTSNTARVNVRTSLEKILLRVDALEAAGAGNVEKYINLDGVSGEITFAYGADDLLNFDKSWSVGVDIVSVPAYANDSMKMCIFSSGGCHLTLNRAGPAPAQMGSYNTSKSDLFHTATRANANTWVPITADSRILYVYDHVAKTLAYWTGERSTGAHGKRATIAVPQTMIDQQVNGGNLCISGSFGGPGGATFDGVRLEAGVDDFIATTSVLTDTEVGEYMSSSDLSTLSFSLFAYAKLGEDSYPSVVDTVGNLTGGTFSGGTSADYKNI